MSSNIKLQRICQHCGSEFTAKTTVTQYCGDKCAKRAYKARQKVAKIETSDKQTKAIKNKPIEDLRAKEYLSIANACQLLGLSRWTLWRAIKKRELTAAKIGRSTLIKRSDIDKLFELQHLPQASKEPIEITFCPDNCYTLSEVQRLYSISDKALYDVIKRNNIPKYKQGIFAYVPKAAIDCILNPQA
ncbi:helix-turn-helix domain-containing protein [Pontibacter arcticus]|uniref:DNA-binding protein n=1 Tax=Pontibacter arcticus TaxID=2080288 RepID=A0A364RCH9_9BACT|nr:helix-turn-helix domain-containing protein [Pontibacter arcticus]RAU81979.1 DNA-binding protein [Pontibacter arcticus]